MEENIKEELLAVAEQSFARFGYKRTVIDDLVREVGIAKGTFYLYFKNKEELLSEVLKKIQQEIGAVLMTQMKKCKTSGEKIRVMMLLSLQSLLERPLLMRLISEDPAYGIFKRLLKRPEFEQQEKETLLFVKAILAEGVSSGEFRKDLNLEVIPFVLGSCKLLIQHIPLITQGQCSAQSYIETLVDTLVCGLLR